MRIGRVSVAQKVRLRSRLKVATQCQYLCSSSSNIQRKQGTANQGLLAVAGYATITGMSKRNARRKSALQAITQSLGMHRYATRGTSQQVALHRLCSRFCNKRPRRSSCRPFKKQCLPYIRLVFLASPKNSHQMRVSDPQGMTLFKTNRMKFGCYPLIFRTDRPTDFQVLMGLDEIG